MTVQLSVAVRNAMLDAYETAIGTGAILKLRTGAQPANCAAADSGTVVASITLASDWMSAASSGSKAFSSTPLTDASADNSGTLAHYRLYASDGTTCHDQGTITATGGGGDMTVDNVSVTATQEIQITSWSKNSQRPRLNAKGSPGRPCATPTTPRADCKPLGKGKNPGGLAASTFRSHRGGSRL